MKPRLFTESFIFKNLMKYLNVYLRQKQSASAKNHNCDHNVPRCLHVTKLHISLFNWKPGKSTFYIKQHSSRSLLVNEGSLFVTESWKTGGDNIFGCGKERQKHTKQRVNVWETMQRQKTESSNCEPWDRRHHTVSHPWLRSRKESSPLKPTANNYDMMLLPFFLYYVQLSVNPMRDQTVHPEEKH